MAGLLGEAVTLLDSRRLPGGDLRAAGVAVGAAVVAANMLAGLPPDLPAAATRPARQA